ncbi:hypothetical protein BH10ACI1_BH10ACI1_23900 [soil metagenome]
MRYSQGQINDMYERALSCLDAEFTDIPVGSDAETAANGLRAAFGEIRQKGTAQAGFRGSAQAGTGQRTTARINIRNYRATLARTANVVARKKSGFNEHFPPPSGETDDELLTNTRAVIAKAIELRSDFIPRGLTMEYLESGTEIVNEFEAAFDAKNEALSHRGAATGSKKSAYQQADENFDELDIYIRNNYRDQPDKINAWRIASHIERSPKKKVEPTP